MTQTDFGAGQALLARAVAIMLATAGTMLASARAGEAPRLFTHQSYVEETARATEVPLGDLKGLLAWVLGNLPERVKVYPTENYYYFRFMHGAQNYAGNIRLDAAD